MEKYFTKRLTAILAAGCICLTTGVYAQNLYQATELKSVVDADLVDPIVGTYNGDLNVNFMGQDFQSQDKITLTKDAADEIGLHLKNFSFADGSIAVGDIDIPNIPVTYTNNTYSFESETISLSIMGGAIMADVKASGTITNGNVNIAIDVKWDNGGTIISIPVTFVGKQTVGVQNELSGSKSNIQSREGKIFVSDYNGTVNVYNLIGVKVYSEKVSGDTNFTLNKGLYIVQTGNRTIKVSVK